MISNNSSTKTRSTNNPTELDLARALSNNQKWFPYHILGGKTVKIERQNRSTFNGDMVDKANQST